MNAETADSSCSSSGPVSGSCRSGALTWSQLIAWLEYENLPPFHRHGLNHVRWLDVPPGATLAHVQTAVDALVERHEVLRTTVDIDSRCLPFQTVHAPSSLPVEAVSVDSETTEDELLTGPLGHLAQRAFQLEREWPIRAAAVTRDARLGQVLLVMHHMAIDAWSFGLISREFAALTAAAAAGEPADLPPVVHHPLDQAGLEQSAAGQRASAAALAYWERTLGSMPHRSFPVKAEPMRRHTRVRLESPAVLAAWRELSRRQQVSFSTALLAAFAIVLGRYTGLESCAMFTLSANRAAHRTRRSVGSFFQPTLVSIELTGDPTCAEVVERTSSATIKAHRHAHYDYAAMRAEQARAQARRGVSFDAQVYFNSPLSFLTPVEPAAGAGPDAPDQPARLLSRSRLSSQPAPAWGLWTAPADMMLELEHTEQAAVIHLSVNPPVVPVAHAERLLRSIEALVVETAEHPALRVSEVRALAEVEPLPRTADWRSIDRCWVDLRDVGRVLRACPGVDAGVVVVEERESRPALVAYVASRDGRTTPAALRRCFLASVREEPSIMAPHRYVVCEEAPADPGDLSAWRRQRVTAAGDGHTAPHAEPRTPAEVALCAAVAQTHGLTRVSTAEGYVQVGGRIERVPSVQRRLLQNGYIGLALEDFCSPCTIAQLASRLFPMPEGGLESLFVATSKCD